MKLPKPIYITFMISIAVFLIHFAAAYFGYAPTIMPFLIVPAMILVFMGIMVFRIYQKEKESERIRRSEWLRKYPLVPSQVFDKHPSYEGYAKEYNEIIDNMSQKVKERYTFGIDPFLKESESRSMGACIDGSNMSFMEMDEERHIPKDVRKRHSEFKTNLSKTGCATITSTAGEMSKKEMKFTRFINVLFKCPYCSKEYDDSNDKYVNRCNKNKDGCTRIKCSCGENFHMTYDYKGHAQSFKKFEK